MQHSVLAADMRARQRNFEELPDDAYLIWAYTTCFACGGKPIAGDDLDQMVFDSTSTNHFFTLLMKALEIHRQVGNCGLDPAQKEALMSARRIEVIQGDITKLAVDAIVNSANWSLRGGGGVDGAIHHAAGRELAIECQRLHGCMTGCAKITGGYRLPAKWIIHTVGPRWIGGGNNEGGLLANAYANSLALALHHGIRTIAFPSISTGAFGFPMNRAVEIALRITLITLAYDTTIDKVIVVCYNPETERAYAEAMQHLQANDGSN